MKGAGKLTPFGPPHQNSQILFLTLHLTTSYLVLLPRRFIVDFSQSPDILALSYERIRTDQPELLCL